MIRKLLLSTRYKVISLFIAHLVIGSPSIAWGWEEGGCSGSKDKANQQTEIDQVEETDA